MACDGCTLFSADDRALYEHKFALSLTEISDACLNSRVAWNPGFSYQRTVLADCLCLVSDGGVFTSPHMTLPIGDLTQDRLQTIIDTLSLVFKNNNWPLRCLYIDEVYLPLFRQLHGYRAEIKNDLNFSDYLYDADSLRALNGKQLHGKRNHFNRFLRSYPDFQFRKLTVNDREGALNLVKDWCQDRQVDCLDPVLSDYLPIRQLFDDFARLDVRGGAIWIGQELVAFAMGSLMRDDTAVIHFEKAHPGYVGLYAAINKLVLEEVFPAIKWINREEDMGIEGLRKAKESYTPVRMIAKYEVSLTSLEG